MSQAKWFEIYCLCYSLSRNSYIQEYVSGNLSLGKSALLNSVSLNSEQVTLFSSLGDLGTTLMTRSPSSVTHKYRINDQVPHKCL
jgi:hypothetical protein